MIEDLNIDASVLQRATNELPDIPAPTPEELPDALAAELLWEMATDGADVGWSRRHDHSIGVYRSDFVLSARLNKADWVFRDGKQRWIPSGGFVEIVLRLENAKPGTPARYMTRFSGPVSREEFIEQIAGLMVDLKEKYVVSELERFKT